MKWRVDIEYEDGSFTEPRRIAFQAVYDGEPYHGYETKREALEAFCLGQVAMSKFLEESKAQQEQAEQKKEEGWDKAIKEAKEKYGYGKPKEMIDVVNDYSPKKEEQKEYPTFEAEQKEIKEALRKMLNEDLKTPDVETRLEALEKKVNHHEEYLNRLGNNLPKSDQRLNDLESRIEVLECADNNIKALENRLTEIEGVLSSIGSPDYDLRKKVEDLEKKYRRLLKDYKTHLFANHNYTMTPKDMEFISQYELEE